MCCSLGRYVFQVQVGLGENHLDLKKFVTSLLVKIAPLIRYREFSASVSKLLSQPFYYCSGPYVSSRKIIIPVIMLRQTAEFVSCVCP